MLRYLATAVRAAGLTYSLASFVVCTGLLIHGALRHVRKKE